MPKKGEKMSPEQRAKISAARMGMRVSAEAGAKIGAANSRRVVTAETRSKLANANGGDRAARWNGGKSTRRKDGRVYVLTHPARSSGSRYRLRSRLVMEEHLGRSLLREEAVHHIDGNPANDAIENLRLFAKSGDHTKFHMALIRAARAQQDVVAASDA